jgi:Lrp/AsnC family transcriptional regulator
VNLSQNACWRRIKRLEEEGFVSRRVALLDPEKLGVGVTVFVAIRAAEHTEDWLEQFAAAVRRIPEVLKLRVADIADYDAVYKRLIRAAKLTDVSSMFVMETLKSTTAIPLPTSG